MVGDSQRRPDRNRRAPEARGRGRSAPNIILITRGRYLDEWPPAQSLSGAVDLFYRRGAAGGAELMEFCSALAIARYHPTGGGYEKVQVGRTHSGSNHISMANAASEGPYYGPPPYYYGPPYSGPRPYRGGEVAYYRPGRHRTWNGCQRGWTVQDGLCKPYARATE